MAAKWFNSLDTNSRLNGYLPSSPEASFSSATKYLERSDNNFASSPTISSKGVPKIICKRFCIPMDQPFKPSAMWRQQVRVNPTVKEDYLIILKSNLIHICFSISQTLKVQTFWEAHKNLRNLPHALYIYLVNVQTMMKIFSNFVCFSESPNFTMFLLW